MAGRTSTFRNQARDDRGRYLSGRATDPFSGGGSSGGIAGLDGTAIGKAKAGLAELAKQVKTVAGDVPGLGEALGAAFSGDVIGGIRNVAAAFSETFAQVGQLAGEITGLTALTGRSAGEMQGLAHATGLAGVGFESLGGALTGLAGRLYSTSTGSVDAILGFSRLGIAVRNTQGEFRDSAEVFNDIAVKLTGIKNSTERVGKALAVGLPQAAEVANRYLLKAGGNAELAAQLYRQAQKDVEEYGARLTGPALRAISEYGDAQAKLALQAQGYKNAIATPLYEAFAEASDAYLKSSKGQSAGLRTTLQGIGLDVGKLAPVYYDLKRLALEIAPAFGLVVSALSGIATGVGYVVTAVAGPLIGAFQALWPVLVPLGAAVAVTFAPLTALFAGIALVIEDIVGYTKGYESVTGDAIQAFKTFVADFTKPQSGDNWLLTSLRDIVRFIATDIPAAWNNLKSLLSVEIPGLSSVSKVADRVAGVLDRANIAAANALGPGRAADFFAPGYSDAVAAQGGGQVVSRAQIASILSNAQSGVPTVPVASALAYSPDYSSSSGESLSSQPVNVTVNVSAGILGDKQQVVDLIKDGAEKAFDGKFRAVRGVVGARR